MIRVTNKPITTLGIPINQLLGSFKILGRLNHIFNYLKKEVGKLLKLKIELIAKLET